METVSHKLVFLTVNDLYELSPIDGWGGIAELKTLLESEKARCDEGDRIVVSVNGDFLSASESSIRYQGKPMIALFNEIGVDMVVLGNHEFDFGASVLQERMAESKFTYFGSNVRQSHDSSLINGVTDTLMMDFDSDKSWGRVRVGMFGLCTADTPRQSNPGPDVVFTSPVEVAEEAVNDLRGRGADAVVALTHLSMAQDKVVAKRATTADGLKGIDLMLGGHDHDPLTVGIGHTIIHKSGQNATWLGRVELKIDVVLQAGARSVNVIPSWSMIPNYRIQPHPATKQLVLEFERQLEVEKSSTHPDELLVLCSTALDTRTSNVRTQETNMGLLVADAMRAEIGTQVAIINGGFIRGNRLYPVDTLITAEAIRKEMPFPREAVAVKIRGSDLVEAVEGMLRVFPEPFGSFPHLSGLRVRFRPDLPPMERITSIHLVDEAGGMEELVGDATYTLALTDFMLQGGDGIDAFTRATDRHVKDRVAEVVVAWLANFRSKRFEEAGMVVDPQCLDRAVLCTAGVFISPRTEGRLIGNEDGVFA